MTCKIGTYNCRGLRDIKTRGAIFEWLKGKKLDIVLWQETHSIIQDEKCWKKEWEGEMYFSHGKRDARGVMVLIKNGSSVKVKESVSDIEGRLIFLKSEIGGKDTLIVNLYAPNEDNPEFYEKIFQQVGEYDCSEVIMGGDYNLVIDIDKDKAGGIAKTNVKAQKCVIKYMELLELCDVWRINHQELKEFTWRRRKPRVIQCRLDFFLVSQSVVNMVEQSKIGTSFKSDHSIVTLSLKLGDIPRGPGYWKLNCSLMKDKEYVDKIKMAIRECENIHEGTDIDKVLLWETMKMQIRSASIEYSCEKRKKARKKEDELEKCVKGLESKTPLTEQETGELDKARVMLEKVIQEKVEGCKVRSRARLYQDDEKSTKYFLGLEKSNQNKKKIVQIKDEEGNSLSEQEKIRREIESYYQKLYKKKENITNVYVKEEFFKSTSKCLTEEEMLTCEGEITRSELLAALKQTKNNKSPGIDGIPVDFYKFFWKEIDTHMLDALNCMFDNGQMSVNHRRGIISLLPKKDKDTLYVKNWRPITLLCCDYKLASKVIANRLKSLLSKLINPDQCGFVSNRYIGQNIDVLTQIIEYSEENDVPGIILSVDYHKAFDELSWSFIEDVLVKYGFGNMLIRWVQLFYNNISAVVNVNGVFTDPFPIEKGVKQGDPASPYLFILCAEVLAEYIRKNQDITGIKIGSTEYKISMLADDTNIFLNFCNKSLDTVLLALDNFASLSGLNINYDKSSAYCIGMAKPKKLSVKYPIRWDNEVIETLGVKIPLQKQMDIEEMNFAPKIAQIETVIKSWLSRNLSLRGKVIVVRSLLLSKLQYLVTVLGIPRQKIIHNVNSIVFKYLWNGSEKLKRRVMINTLEEGGLNVPDFETICKAALIRWIHRYIHAEESNWTKLVDNTLKDVGGKLVFQCNLDGKETVLNNIKSVLWRKIVQIWCEMNYIEKEYISKNDIVWLNSRLSTLLYNRECIDKGLLFVKQLYKGRDIIPYGELCNTYNVRMNILYYHNIVYTINEKIQIEQCKDIQPDKEYQNIVQTVFDKPSDKLLCKKVYNYLIKRKVQKNEIHDKWGHIHINEDKKLFRHIERCTIVNKLRSFQFKFLHKILYFNERLFKCKLSTSSLCDFCHENIDSLEHRYFYCRITQEFLSNLTTWVKSKFNIVCEFQNVQFIITNSCTSAPVMDTILLHAKYYIYTCFIKKSLPHINVFIDMIEDLENTEKQIAEEKNRLFAHNKKWNIP